MRTHEQEAQSCAQLGWLSADHLMSRSFVLSLQRPHEALGVPLPMARRVSRIRTNASVATCCIVSMVCLGFSIISVNTSAAKTFDRRTLEKRAEQLAEEVSDLESRAAVLQSYSSLQERVRDRGYHPVEKVQYIDAR